MNKFISTLTCLFIVSIAPAQSSNDAGKSMKQFYTEAGGPGILFSANYDSRFKPDTRGGFGFRAGIGFTLVDEANYIAQSSSSYYYDYKTRSIATIPLGINYLFAKPSSPNMFEVGAGVTILSKKASVLNYNDYKEGNLLGHFDFMYRRQPVDGGFSWRIGFTPIINSDGDIFPFAAIGLGFAFK